MSLSITAGAAGLLQLGLSISDVALLWDAGRRFGNFMRVSETDEELFGILSEPHEALLKRRGLVDTATMEAKWSHIIVFFEGNRAQTKTKEQGRQDLSRFSWLMMAIVAALDICLPASAIQSLLIEVIAKVLETSNDKEEIRNALNVQMRQNIESWRQASVVRGMHHAISESIRQCMTAKENTEAFALNDMEKIEVECLLVWLLGGESQQFSALSSATFAIADGIAKAGIKLKTDGQPDNESEPFVTLIGDSPDDGATNHPLRHGSFRESNPKEELTTERFN